MSDVYQCRQCREEGRKYMLSPIAFGADECSQILDKILREGAWARCLSCQEVARARRAAQGLDLSASLAHALEGEDDVSCGEDVFKCDRCGLRKRASRYSLSMIKHVGRNKLMLCRKSEHQPCKGVDCERMLTSQEMEGDRPSLCAVCKPIPCTACKKEYPAQTWNAHAQKKFRSRGARSSAHRVKTVAS